MAPKRNRSPWLHIKPYVDAGLMLLAFALAYWVRYHLQWLREVEPAYHVPFSVYLPSALTLTGILLFVYWLEGAYRMERGRALYDELYVAFRGTLIGIAAMIVGVFIFSPGYYSRLIFGYTGVITLLLIGISRAAERAVITQRRRRGKGVDRLLIVGAGEVARSIMRIVVARPELGYQIVGFLDDDEKKSQTHIGRYTALGTTDKLTEVLATHRVDEVIITLPWVSHRRIMQIMAVCEGYGLRVRIVPDLFQLALHRVAFENLDGIPLLGVREPTLREWQVVLKRALDLLMAGLGLILLSPLMGIIALAIKLDSPGPVIFRQVRVGRDGREFVCFKFRTMHADAEERLQQLQTRNEASGPLFKMRHDPRRTRIGRILRRGLDELPQLWNVLRGEMSVVGPRAGLPAEIERYEPWHRRRLEIAQGITGLWQVSGRSDLTFDEMVLLDIYYIENWSLFLDLRILLKTLPIILLGSGGY